MRGKKRQQRTGRFPEKEVESQLPLHPLPCNYFRMRDISITQLQYHTTPLQNLTGLKYRCTGLHTEETLESQGFGYWYKSGCLERAST